MILIFVESPNKAKAIKEYLKHEKEKYKVLATVGHIRNLSKKSGSVKTNENFEYIWEFTPQWDKNKKDILSSAKEADFILIASDPDREGEAIAWHLSQVLKENNINTPTKRILFHSISKSSILAAIQNTIDIRKGLVQSYLARVGLDYLFGYSISELLWRKVPCCKSAGRVQSASLKLIVERENEILHFQKRKYITVHAEFNETRAVSMLTENNSIKFESGNIFNEQEVDLEILRRSKFQIQKIIKQRQKQNPPAPLITSTLQQLASSQLNFSPKITMQLAQKLYEGFSINGKHTGLITYMRTDSFNIEKEALQNIRKTIISKYGEKYLSEEIVHHKKNVKNAQEAHEAIRPTHIELNPDSIEFPDNNLKKLYNLIWKRTLASQCKPALFDKTSVTIEATKEENKGIFLMTSFITIFNSFKDIIEEENNEKTLNDFDFSSLYEKQILNLKDIYTKDHETQPPKRFSEAGFINQLEKLGIGRPSTYAKISSVLLEREYIEKQKKIVSPTQKGWLVTSFLSAYFENEIAYQFTSSMEEKLDELVNSNESYIPMLKSFWQHLKHLVDESKIVPPVDVSHSIEKIYPDYFLSSHNKCICGNELMLKIGKYGALRGCINYPNCTNTLSLTQKNISNESITQTKDGHEIIIKNGPFGLYVQIEADPPKKIPIPKIWLKNQETISEEQAIILSELPKELGMYMSKPVKISIGRFGLYIQHNSTFVSINSVEISLEEAIKKIEQKEQKIKNMKTK